MLVLCIAATFSCAYNVPLPERLDNVVELAEADPAMDYESWEALKEEYYMIMDEFRATASNYTREEKQEIYRLSGKMNGIISKRTAGQVIDGLKDLNESLPAMVDGFIEGISDIVNN